MLFFAFNAKAQRRKGTTFASLRLRAFALSS